jgi:uncharacterized protein (TIGR00369 family)
MQPAVMDVDELNQFFRAQFPPFFADDSGLSIERVWRRGSVVRQAYRERFVRPGGTISGPTMMALADYAMYVAVLGAIGPVSLAVTTSLNINFLRRPRPQDLLAEARLLKLGSRLAVGDVAIRSEGEDDLAAHATLTYSIPPRAAEAGDV